MDCALFCAPSPSKTIVKGSTRAVTKIVRASAKNQHHSKSSHSVRKMSAAIVNRKFATAQSTERVLSWVGTISGTFFVNGWFGMS